MTQEEYNRDYKGKSGVVGVGRFANFSAKLIFMSAEEQFAEIARLNLGLGISPENAPKPIPSFRSAR